MKQSKIMDTMETYHRGKILCSLFLLFSVRSIKPGIMSSSSSNNMEEDAWLMKIELKREEPTDAVKGDKGKEADTSPSYL